MPAVHRNSYPFYAFRLWHGMTTSVLLRLFARNRFAVSPSRVPLALLALIYALNNSVMKAIEAIIFAKQIDAVVLERPPIFIIGHWRTGTTHLHELLALDDDFVAPSTLECVVPAQFLAFGWLIRAFAFLLPTNRPMDNMLVGWNLPQEDEIALLALGLGSPYEAMIFPNHRVVGHAFLNMTETTPEQVEAWRTGLLRFLKRVSFLGDRRAKCAGKTRQLILKSPTHTARLHLLRQMFPGAKFIHVVRHPCDVYSSTIRLWRALYDTQGCQKPDYGALPNGAPAIEQYVFDTMDLLYRDFFTQLSEIPVENYCQVRYEDLVRSPVAEIERIYRQLDLQSFERIRPCLEARLSEGAAYKAHHHLMSDDEREEVCRRWGWYLDKFGYRGDPVRGAVGFSGA